jgi:hypothetical protein
MVAANGGIFAMDEHKFMHPWIMSACNEAIYMNHIKLKPKFMRLLE